MAKLDDRDFEKLVRDLEGMLDRVVQNAAVEMKKLTPKRSGYARSKTSRINDTTIKADYAYADRLDNGWSNQAPRGFTEPTIDYITKSINREIGRM